MSVKNKNYQKLPNTKPDVYLKYEKGPYKKKKPQTEVSGVLENNADYSRSI